MNKSLTAQNQSQNNANIFRKSNDAIGLRPVEGTISMLARKIFNVLISYAQDEIVPGNNAPIDNDIDLTSKYFWLPISEFTRSLEYESKDIATLKDVIDGMRRIKLVAEDEHRWALEGMISSAIIVKASDPSNKTGHNWLGFAFPPHLQKQIITPDEYTKMSLAFQVGMRSGASIALYEICRRFATNPSKKTFIKPIEFWYPALTGNPFNGEKIEYKYFKRDTIKESIAEVNQTTDIMVDLIEHKTGRRVTDLQFHVEIKQQGRLMFDDSGLIDSKVIERIRKAGISHNIAKTIYSSFSIDVIEAALDQLERKIEESRTENSTKIESVPSYFRWLLNNVMAGNNRQKLKKQKEKEATLKTSEVDSVDKRKEEQAPEIQSKPRKSGSQLMSKYLAERGEKAYEKYVSLNETERITIYQSFSEANANTGFKLEKGLALKSNRKVFGIWYAKHIWGDPTAEAVAEFVSNL